MSRFLEGHLASLALGSALALGLYVFLGPPAAGRRRGHLRGLANSGNLCFVNAVVQALAACPSLQAWLEERSTRRDARTVRGSLLHLLRLLNNLPSSSSTPPSDTLSPALLLAALRCTTAPWASPTISYTTTTTSSTTRAHGWRINTEEQDAHEMLHVVMTSIEEEVSGCWVVVRRVRVVRRPSEG